MGWGDCGTDSGGRPIGYIFDAICDEPGCEIEITRGLAFSCGNMHGENGYDCEKYFCGNHLFSVELKEKDRYTEKHICTGVCNECWKLLEEEDLLTDDE